MNVKQTIIVSKSKANTKLEAQRIAKRYADRIYTSRETSSSFRFRQRPPSHFKQDTFRTHHVAPGVSIVTGELR